MNKADLCKKLYDLQDLKYRDMQIKIIPTISPESVIGVRTPELRSMAKDIMKAVFPLLWRRGLMTGRITKLSRKVWKAEELRRNKNCI